MGVRVLVSPDLAIQLVGSQPFLVRLGAEPIAAAMDRVKLIACLARARRWDSLGSAMAAVPPAGPTGAVTLFAVSEAVGRVPAAKLARAVYGDFVAMLDRLRLDDLAVLAWSAVRFLWLEHLAATLRDYAASLPGQKVPPEVQGQLDCLFDACRARCDIEEDAEGTTDYWCSLLRDAGVPARFAERLEVLKSLPWRKIAAAIADLLYEQKEGGHASLEHQILRSLTNLVDKTKADARARGIENLVEGSRGAGYRLGGHISTRFVHEEPRDRSEGVEHTLYLPSGPGRTEVYLDRCKSGKPLTRRQDCHRALVLLAKHPHRWVPAVDLAREVFGAAVRDYHPHARRPALAREMYEALYESIRNFFLAELFDWAAEARPSREKACRVLEQACKDIFVYDPRRSGRRGQADAAYQRKSWLSALDDKRLDLPDDLCRELRDQLIRIPDRVSLLVPSVKVLDTFVERVLHGEDPLRSEVFERNLLAAISKIVNDLNRAAGRRGARLKLIQQHDQGRHLGYRLGARVVLGDESCEPPDGGGAEEQDE